ncbi:MAG: hypothetical protein U0S12_14905 [Fimbriimonadales bacterium]
MPEETMARKADDDRAHKDGAVLTFMAQVCFLLALDWFYKGIRYGVDWQRAIGHPTWDGRNAWLTYFSLGLTSVAVGGKAMADKYKPRNVEGVLVLLGTFFVALGLFQTRWLQVLFASLGAVCMVYRGTRSGWSKETREEPPEDTAKPKEDTVKAKEDGV